MEYYQIKYSTYAHWEDKDAHNGGDSACIGVEMSILSNDLEQAIETSKKALTAITRDNNGQKAPYVSRWKLESAEAFHK